MVEWWNSIFIGLEEEKNGRVSLKGKLTKGQKNVEANMHLSELYVNRSRSWQKSTMKRPAVANGAKSSAQI